MTPVTTICGVSARKTTPITGDYLSQLHKQVDLLRTVAGFWISDEVYKEILNMEGEL